MNYYRFERLIEKENRVTTPSTRNNGEMTEKNTFPFNSNSLKLCYGDSGRMSNRGSILVYYLWALCLITCVLLFVDLTKKDILCPYGWARIHYIPAIHHSSIPFQPHTKNAPNRRNADTYCSDRMAYVQNFRNDHRLFSFSVSLSELIRRNKVSDICYKFRSRALMSWFIAINIICMRHV